MSDYYINPNDPDSLTHFGIPGMKWGDRKYQYEDGSLTPAGRERYGVGEKRSLADNIHAYRVKKKRKKSLEKARKTRAKNQAAKKKADEAAAKRQDKLKRNYQSENARNTFKNLDKMTDQEVQAATSRLRNEQAIQQMAVSEMNAERAANPSKYEKAAQFIAKAIKVSGDIATVAENTRKVTDALGITQKADKNKNKGNNNGNNNNQNQNGKKNNNKGDTLKGIGKAIENSINQETAAKARRDKTRNTADDKNSKMLSDNQQRVNDFNKNVQLNNARIDSQARYQQSITPSFMSDATYTTSLSDISYDLGKLKYGKDILEAMGLD